MTDYLSMFSLWLKVGLFPRGHSVKVIEPAELELSYVSIQTRDSSLLIRIYLFMFFITLIERPLYLKTSLLYHAAFTHLSSLDQQLHDL